ncbi:MAG: hypothetical protein LBK54_02200 [Propionibacteriaceae bacterium]|jgi:hypothetical protein|nr:hypothetical protein [Propionibacteriaceae bacterium]
MSEPEPDRLDFKLIKRWLAAVLWVWIVLLGALLALSGLFVVLGELSDQPDPRWIGLGLVGLMAGLVVVVLVLRWGHRRGRHIKDFFLILKQN